MTGGVAAEAQADDAPRPSPPGDNAPCGAAKRRALHALAVACLLVLAAARCMACPFCGIVGESLAQRRDRAACVAIGDVEGPPLRDAAGLPAARITVVQVVRATTGLEIAAGAVVVARVAGPISGTALLFAEQGDVGEDGIGADRLTWSAIAADETLIGHVLAAPAADLPAERRLRWYAPRLDHRHSGIAADAFTEFGLAPYDAVRAVADAFDGAALRRWIVEPGIDQRRRGFHGLALGLVAAQTPDSAERDAARAALREAVSAPADDFRAGFDGLLAGLLVSDGPSGLDVIDRLGLLAPTARPVDQRHVLAALRFAWEHLGDTIPQAAVAAATARLVAAPVVAAEAAVDLARYGHWDAVDEVAALWDRLGDDDPLVRRAVAGYLTRCPLPAARRHLEAIRRDDPQRLEQAIEATLLPLPR